MNQVQTIKGLVDRDQLVVKDIVTDEDNARVIATEWYMGGELVRRDVTVSVLRGLELTGEQETI